MCGSCHESDHFEQRAVFSDPRAGLVNMTRGSITHVQAFHNISPKVSVVPMSVFGYTRRLKTPEVYILTMSRSARNIHHIQVAFTCPGSTKTRRKIFFGEITRGSDPRKGRTRGSGGKGDPTRGMTCSHSDHSESDESDQVGSGRVGPGGFDISRVGPGSFEISRVWSGRIRTFLKSHASGRVQQYQ